MRFYLGTEPIAHKVYALMHDRRYRVEVARRQTTHNQTGRACPCRPGAQPCEDRRDPLLG